MYTGLVAVSILSLVLIWQVPVLRDNFFSRVATSTDLSDPNAEVRMSRWVLAASYFLDNPVNGSMLRNEYYDSSFLFDMPPHNWVFEVLPTQGLVGLLFYVAIFYLVLGAGMKNKSDPLTWQMTLLIIFYLAFCMANANFLVKWNIHMLAYPCAVILYRNRVLGENHKHDPSTAIA